MNRLEPRKCSDCGAEIFDVALPDGGTIPLNKVRARAYEIDRDSATPATLDLGLVYISHFLTCRNPSKFSGKGKR